MARVRTEIAVLVWRRDAVALARGGLDVQRVDDEETLVRLAAAAPCAFVVLHGDGSLALSKRMREQVGGDRALIAIAGVDPAMQRDAFAAGADLAWPADVDDAIVEAAVRRASARFAAARDALSVDEAVVSSVIASAPQPLFVVSEDAVIRSANAGVRAMLGHPPPELEGRSLLDLVHDDDRGLVRDLVADAAGSRDLAPPTVVRARRHDGSFVEIELGARSMLHEPAIRAIFVDAREAFERMSVGEALQESEMRFGAIFENLLDGLVQIDVDSRRLVKANPAFCRITGYAPEDVSRHTLLDLFPAKDRDRAREILDAHFRGERGVSEALEIEHASGTPLYVDLGTTCMELSGVRFMLAVLRDVTARRETERTREVFLAVVAHELRTPVAVLQNSVGVLKAQPPPSPADHDVLVNVLAEEVQRLSRLVADALDLGAIQAGTLTLRPLCVDLAPLVTSVVSRVALQFDGHASLDVHAVDARVDPLRFEQIVTNLVDNAWRHGGERDIEVTLTEENGCARLDVVDHGPGLPDDLRHTVFERVLLPSARPTAGIGIGMWLSKRLVCAMGGTIQARESTSGRGLHVTVLFPRADESARKISV